MRRCSLFPRLRGRRARATSSTRTRSATIRHRPLRRPRQRSRRRLQAGLAHPHRRHPAPEAAAPDRFHARRLDAGATCRLLDTASTPAEDRGRNDHCRARQLEPAQGHRHGAQVGAEMSHERHLDGSSHRKRPDERGAAAARAGTGPTGRCRRAATIARPSQRQRAGRLRSGRRRTRPQQRLAGDREDQHHRRAEDARSGRACAAGSGARPRRSRRAAPPPAAGRARARPRPR